MLAALYTVVIFAQLKTYICAAPILVLLGIGGLANAVEPATKPGRVLPFILPAILFTVLYMYIPAKTFLFMAVITSVIGIIVSRNLYIPGIAWFMLVFMTPLCEYACTVFSFPVRMQLSTAAGFVLRLTGRDYTAEGNMIGNNGELFSVDPACMGLSMLSISLLCSAIIFSILAARARKKVSFLTLFTFFCLVVMFNILSNLLRIVILVYFAVPPASVTHELAGLACFLVYVLLPCWLLAKKMIGRLPQREPVILFNRPNVPSGLPARHTALHLATCLLICCTAFTVKGSSFNGATQPAAVPGYTATAMNDNILKLDNGSALIYIKPMAGFYSADHNPMICWSGSGFEFQGVMEKNCGNMLVYTATLVKGGDELYTAWWYESGDDFTTSQAEWRWSCFRYGKKYRLVNITAASPAVLKSEIIRFRQSAKSIAG